MATDIEHALQTVAKSTKARKRISEKHESADVAWRDAIAAAFDAGATATDIAAAAEVTRQRVMQIREGRR